MVPGARSTGAFPGTALRDLEGTRRPLSEAWSEGEALVLIGHHECKTTRETLPCLDRMHRRRGPGHAVRLVLQDDAETARGLVKELGLEVPVRLEEDPYPLAADLGLIAVPTLFLVGTDGRIARVSEGFSRADLEGFAERLGVKGPLFVPEDEAPEFRPG
jgi:hypothetical protein